MNKFSILRTTDLILLASILCALFSLPLAAASKPDRTPGFAKFDARAKKGDILNVVFFGGSLTWGAQATDPQLTSCRALMAQKFQKAYPRAHFRFWDASIGGIGSQLGAFRLERDVLSRKPDLVFLDFTVNDGCYDVPDPDKLASYESLVRRMVLANIPIVEVIFALKKDMPPNVIHRDLDGKHKEIAAAYNVPIADTEPVLRKAVDDGKVTPDELWPMFPDETHPGDKGYALYSEAVWNAYQQAVTDKIVCRAPKNMLNADTYMTVNRARISSLGSLPSGWKVGLPNTQAIAYDFLPSRWLDDVTIASRDKENGPQPEALTFKVRAKDVLLFGEATPSSGKYQIRIDGVDLKVADGRTMAEHGNLRYIENITTNLDPAKEHLIELIPQLEPGQELRLESVCATGGPASVTFAVTPPKTATK
jgi:lysophospholipase L1-like esterase